MDEDDALYDAPALPPEFDGRPVTERIGVGAESDEGMERFARLAQHLLGVPAAVVSLAGKDHHVLPGLVGLEEPWSSSRSVTLPLGKSTNTPIEAESVQEALTSVAEALGAVAWVGAPLTDTQGGALGFLIAIDTVARTWDEREHEALHSLAHVCGTELRLRLLVQRSKKARVQAQNAYERSQRLVRTADELAGTADLVAVRRSVKALVTRDLRPVQVELMVVEDNRLCRVDDPEEQSETEMSYEGCDLDSDRPEARAVRTRTVVEVPDTAALARQPPEVQEVFSQLGMVSAVLLPLPGDQDPVGALVLGWDVPYKMTVEEQSFLRALAEYAARAVGRVMYVTSRVQAAESMQRAMLTEVPDVDGLEIEAFYHPAARGATVGGDWYDVYPLPADESGTLAITVGDITGHDLQAAILMGQVRTMLRQADLDHPGHGPARIVSAFERANRELGLRASGTMVHAHLKPLPEGWLLTWTNAGHPGPLIASADGVTERLAGHDMLFNPDLPNTSRTDHQWILKPGSTLLMFTDGLVEHRSRDMDTIIDRTARMLVAGNHRPLPDLLQRIAQENMVEVRGDDVVLLAIRLAKTGPLRYPPPGQIIP